MRIERKILNLILLDDIVHNILEAIFDRLIHRKPETELSVLPRKHGVYPTFVTYLKGENTLRYMNSHFTLVKLLRGNRSMYTLPPDWAKTKWPLLVRVTKKVTNTKVVMSHFLEHPHPMSPETNDISYQKKHESGNQTAEELFPVVLTVEPPTAW